MSKPNVSRIPKTSYMQHRQGNSYKIKGEIAGISSKFLKIKDEGSNVVSQVFHQSQKDAYGVDGKRNPTTYVVDREGDIFKSFVDKKKDPLQEYKDKKENFRHERTISVGLNQYLDNAKSGDKMPLLPPPYKNLINQK